MSWMRQSDCSLLLNSFRPRVATTVLKSFSKAISKVLLLLSLVPCMLISHFGDSAQAQFLRPIHRPCKDKFEP